MVRKKPVFSTPRYSVERTTKAKGSKHYRTQLNDDDVRLILQLHDDGMSQAQIGRKFDVGRHVIHFIVNGKTWCHVV